MKGGNYNFRELKDSTTTPSALKRARGGRTGDPQVRERTTTSGIQAKIILKHISTAERRALRRGRCECQEKRHHTAVIDQIAKVASPAGPLGLHQRPDRLGLDWVALVLWAT
jgi:hypothetical protein